MSQCGSINVCSLCVCVCGIDFYFHFLSGINKMYLKSLYSSASQETYYTLSSVLRGHCSRCSAICQSCFLQKLHNSSAWKNEGCRRTGEAGKKTVLDFGLCSSCILQDLQVGGGEL